MRHRWRFTFCALGGLGIACSEAAEAPEAQGVARSAIVYGERSDEQDDAVVRLLIPSHETLCSGTLVAPNLVVTALHCVAEYDAFGTFSCDSKGALSTSTPPDGQLGVTVPPAEVEIHTGAIPDNVVDAYGARVFGSGSTVICRNDIAFVLLDRELDAPVVPMRRLQPTVRTEAMRIVGYGRTEAATSIGRYRRDGVLVTAVGAVGLEPAAGSAAPNTFVLGPGACQGDSGGPALDETTHALTGVYSLSAGTSCESALIKNVYTNVAAFTTLSDRAFEAAGHTPIAEPGDGAAGGDAGGAGGESSGGAAGETGSGGGANGGTPSSGGSDVGSGGTETSGGSSSQGGSRSSGGAIGEGSGSRRDSSCALRGRPDVASGLASALAALAFAGVTALRRRQRR